MIRIAPSLFAADLANLAGGLEICACGGAELVHIDVMDGHFVPNLTFGGPVVRALARRTTVPLDVHLMVEQPDRLLESYLCAGVQRLCVHWEAEVHLDRTLATIRAAGVEAGVALNPATPVSVLEEILPALDFVLLMSVNPGFSGQRFLPYVLEKSRRLRDHATERGLQTSIAMDGGIDLGNVGAAVAAGVDTLVAGSAVFAAADPATAIRALAAIAREVTK